MIIKIVISQLFGSDFTFKLNGILKVSKNKPNFVDLLPAFNSLKLNRLFFKKSGDEKISLFRIKPLLKFY